MNKTLIAISSVLTGVSLVSAFRHYKQVKAVEDAKIEKIHKWEAENSLCIARAQERLDHLLEDPETTLEDFWTEYQIEMRYLEIVQNQPMY